MTVPSEFDVRVGEVVEVDELGVEAAGGAVGEGDEVGLQTDGSAAGEAASAVNLGDPAANLRADGNEDDAVLRDRLDELRRGRCRRHGLSCVESGVWRRARSVVPLVQLAGNVRYGGDDVCVGIGGGREQAAALWNLGGLLRDCSGATNIGSVRRGAMSAFCGALAGVVGNPRDVRGRRGDCRARASRSAAWPRQFGDVMIWSLSCSGCEVPVICRVCRRKKKRRCSETGEVSLSFMRKPL